MQERAIEVGRKTKSWLSQTTLKICYHDLLVLVPYKAILVSRAGPVAEEIASLC